MEDWEFSSYIDYIGSRNGTLPEKEIILPEFIDLKDFRNFMEKNLNDYEENFEKYLFE